MKNSDNLIPLDQLIKEAKKAGINFGKGDPYNRLRYYTKIGWLPHMTRKKGGKRAGNIKGHYPAWTLERLINIEELKKSGLANDKIAQKLRAGDKKRTLYMLIKSPEVRTKAIIYSSFVLLTLIFTSELGIISLSKQKSLITQSGSGISNNIIASGTAFIPQNKREIFVKTAKILSTYKVHVTFNSNFAPASRFWIEDKRSLEGFTVKLDAPVAKNAEFSWWITN